MEDLALQISGKGKVVAEMSLRHVVPALSDALGRKVVFAEDCVGDAARAAIAAMREQR